MRSGLLSGFQNDIRNRYDLRSRDTSSQIFGVDFSNPPAPITPIFKG